MTNQTLGTADDGQFKVLRFICPAVALALVVPYATGTIAYLHSVGRFPLQPRDYLLLAVLISVVIGFIQPPRLVPGFLVLLGLLAVRLLDAAMLHRVIPIDDISIVSQTGASIAFAIGCVCLAGNRETIRNCAVLCGGFTLLINVGVNAWEWRNPGSFSTVDGRSAGMLGNANDSAHSIVSMLAVVLAVAPPFWMSAGMIALSGAGVYFTLSRGGAVIWLMVVGVYLILVARERVRHIIGLGIWLAAMGFIVLRIVNFDSVQSTDKNVLTRQGELLGREAVDVNDTERIDLLREGIAGIRAAPLQGYGTGASWGSPFLPHNELIAVWLDNGISGIGLYLLALGLLVTECVRNEKVLLVGCVPLCFETLFCHTLLEDKSYLFCWVILAGMLQFAPQSKPELEIEPDHPDDTEPSASRRVGARSSHAPTLDPKIAAKGLNS